MKSLFFSPSWNGWMWLGPFCVSFSSSLPLYYLLTYLPNQPTTSMRQPESILAVIYVAFSILPTS
ncbi:hypothetical protein BO79DRAFT_49033 [Aspergillus costaricaensis CBS 115574]|uniref:Uncharacterized protein n=1 Tax=Aspergillus costaricaensis CBS 115574 TaxID=1448317 RepID=A0ACD1I466_9EURO|nr:hypothetical protein BO79DRAFT_49033 [Aspergillus costaricaensis CBS 115574]RAK85099.1 hypothetical protein BO79DRAFT_49033 [Aspergillus costaricaensis CBS 115574]